MIGKKTVLILGAGASLPYGFPLADTLTTLCGRETRVRTVLQPGYFGMRYTANEMIKEFQIKLMGSQSKSIDRLLEREDFRDWILIGKMLISSVIFKAESSSYGTILKNDMVKDNWYKELVNLLYLDVANETDFKENKLTIVTFNYDRSIDYFLSNTYLHTFNLPRNQNNLNKIFQIIPVIHIYGSLGDLYKNESRIPEYGNGSFEKSTLESMANNIKIWSENETNPAIETAKEAILRAENVFTIGYGFHPQNNLRLGLNNLSNQNRIATVFNATTQEINRYKKTCNFSDYLPLPDSRISELFRRELFELMIE